MWEGVIVGVIIAFGLAIIGLIITLILRIGDKTDSFPDFFRWIDNIPGVDKWHMPVCSSEISENALITNTTAF